MNLPTTTRSARPEDINFILNSWLKSYRCHEDMTRMTNDDYFKYYKQQITSLLQTASVNVLCEAEDDNFIYSWLCYDIVKSDLIIHYIYTRYSHRKLGCAKRLIDELTPKKIYCTSANRVFDELKKKIAISYNPFIIKR